jgi:hypothetical protein
MSLDIRGIKARPHDLDAMMAHQPSLVELHCSVGDLSWFPQQRYNVPLAVHLPEFSEQGELLDPASLDEGKRMRAQTIYAGAVKRAVEWGYFFQGRPRVVFHPGGAVPEGEEGPEREALLAALSKTTTAIQQAAGEAADVLVENLPGKCWFYGGSWDSLIMTTGRDLAAFCSAQGIGATLDLCHLHLAVGPEHTDPAARARAVVAEITAALPHVQHVHYSGSQVYDAAGAWVNKEGLQVGEGDAGLPDYFEALAPVLGASAREVFAVPEIWFGHERGGAGFVEAWKRAQALRAPAGVGA